jgi:hypothetical protein
MAQEDPNRFSEWLMLLRRQAPIVRQRAADWVDAVREEPILIWHTPAVRYGVYFAVGMVLMWGGVRLTRALAPPLPSGARAVADSADFHVVCSNEACNAHFIIHREFGFDDFPVECPACKQLTGRAAVRCNAPACKGRWVAPLPDGDQLKCPHCGRRLD